jgi:hypothetical protein
MKILKADLKDMLTAVSKVTGTNIVSPHLAQIRFHPGRVEATDGSIAQVVYDDRIDFSCMVDPKVLMKFVSLAPGKEVQLVMTKQDPHLLQLVSSGRNVSIKVEQVIDIPDAGLDAIEAARNGGQEIEWVRLPEIKGMSFSEALDMTSKFVNPTLDIAVLNCVNVGASIEATDSSKAVSVAVSNFNRGKSMEGMFPYKAVRLMVEMQFNKAAQTESGYVFVSPGAERWLATTTENFPFPSVLTMVGNAGELKYLGEWDIPTATTFFTLFEYMVGKDNTAGVELKFEGMRVLGTSAVNIGNALDTIRLSVSKGRKANKTTVQVHPKHILPAAMVCSEIYQADNTFLCLKSPDQSIICLIPSMV